ncbi:Pentatricopeptide repeat-containing protein At1g62910 [Durusdinium trenchii]
MTEVKTEPNLIMCNGAISALSKGHQWQLALTMMKEMAAMPLERDITTFTSAVGACAEAEWKRSLCLVEAAALLHIRSDVVIYTIAIKSYSLDKNNRQNWRLAIGVSDQLEEVSIKIDTAFAGTVIGACGQASMWRLAMQAMHAMLQELPEQKFRSGPSCSALYTNVIAMCGQQVQWQRALFWIQHMSDQNFAASTVPYTAAMAACADSDQWQAALVLLSHLEEEKCQLDAVTYSPIIASCHWQISLVLVSEMEQRTIQRNLITLNSAIHACGKSSRWTEALLLFHGFEGQGIERDIVTFNSAMLACSAATRWASVLNVLSQLNHSQIKGNTLTYTIAAGCGWAVPSSHRILAALESAGIEIVKEALA